MSRRISPFVLFPDSHTNLPFSEVYGVNSCVKEKSYTMAADMWSIAALTTALILEAPFFLDSNLSTFHGNPAGAALEEATRLDLDIWNDESLWHGIDSMINDSLKQLFMLNGTKRMKVGPALEHSWFTHGDRKGLIADKYRRAISAWKPSRVRLDYKEDLKVFLEADRVRTAVQSGLP